MICDSTGSETGNRNRKIYFRFPVSEPVESHIVRTVLKIKTVLLFIKTALKLIV